MKRLFVRTVEGNSDQTVQKARRSLEAERDALLARFDGRLPLGRTLEWLEYLRQQNQLVLAPDEPFTGRTWLNAVGVMLEWYSQGLIRNQDPIGGTTLDDVARLVVLAAHTHEIENMLHGVSHSVYKNSELRHRFSGRTIGFRLTHLEPAIEAAQYRLNHQRALRLKYAYEKVTEELKLGDLQSDLDIFAQASTSHPTPSRKLRAGLTQLCIVALLGEQPNVIPLDKPLRGLNTYEACVMFSAIHTEVTLREVLSVPDSSRNTIVRWADRQKLEAWLSEATGLARGTCKRFVDEMTTKVDTYDRQRPRPLLEVEGSVIAPFNLVSSYNFVRNRIALLGGGGEAGRLQGLHGEKALIAGFRGKLEVKRSLYLYRPDGSKDLDLDVYVWSESEQVGIVISAMSPIGPDGYLEGARLSSRYLKKQDDLLRARRGLEDGSLHFEHDHELRMGRLRRGDWTWLVVGAHYLPFDPKVRNHSIPYLSFDAMQQIAERLVRPHSLARACEFYRAWMREIATATAFKTIVRGYVVGNCLFEFDEIQLEQDSSGAEQMFEMVMDSSRSGANAFGIIVSDSEGHRLPSMEVRRINFE